MEHGRNLVIVNPSTKRAEKNDKLEAYLGMDTLEDKRYIWVRREILIVRYLVVLIVDD
jgi:hypothetical protein